VILLDLWIGYITLPKVLGKIEFVIALHTLRTLSVIGLTRKFFNGGTNMLKKRVIEDMNGGILVLFLMLILCKICKGLPSVAVLLFRDLHGNGDNGNTAVTVDLLR